MRPEPISREEKAAWIARFEGICLSSDAFIPFRDNIDRASRSHVQYVAQPGHSLRDDDVTAAAEQYGMTMIHTGLRLFLQKHPLARVAVFSATQDEFVVRQARVLGAVGYVSKGSNVHQLQEALISILQSPHGIEGRLPPIGTASFPRLPVTAVYDRVAELGPRHLEILELVLSGCTNQEISTATKLSLGTVKNYVSSLLLALDVRSRSHLISLFR